MVPHEHVHAIMNAIVEAAGLETAGKGLAFSLPIDDIVGLFRPEEDSED